MSRLWCPICNQPTCTSPKFALDFVQPDGWSLPTHYDVVTCKRCGFIYYDADATQKNFDDFYSNHYSGYGVLNEESREALDGIIRVILKYFKKSAHILDFGDPHGYLTNELKKLGYKHVESADIARPPQRDSYDVIVISEVLEHVWDLHEFLRRVTQLSDNLIIEVPDAYGMETSGHVIGDYHIQHVNHFTGLTLNALLLQYGYRGNDMWVKRLKKRYVVVGDLFSKVSPPSIDFMNRYEYQQIIKDLKAIKRQVVVWGFGMIMQFMPLVDLDIAYFVCNDPAFKDATIQGKPVYETIQSDHPILVCAGNQRDELIARIKRECNNEVIVI